LFFDSRLEYFKRSFFNAARSNPDPFVKALRDVFTKLDMQQAQGCTPSGQVQNVSIAEVRVILASIFKSNKEFLQLRQMNDAAEVFDAILGKLAIAGMQNEVHHCFYMVVKEERAPDPNDKTAQLHHTYVIEDDNRYE
jgi:hypothetical protein